MTRSIVVVLVTILAALGSGTTPVLASGQARPERRQETPLRIDVSKLGPQVGERVPNFTLQDQSGKAWTLQSIMGPHGAMLVFYRSAGW